MADLKPGAIEIFGEFSSAVNKTRREVISQDWFGENWWINLSFGNRGFGFQLSRTNWFNHAGQGIHFEFWIGERELQDRALPIVLHFEPDTPGREELGVSFRTALAPFEKDFGDYRINHRAICDKMQKQETLSKSGLSRVIVREFTKLKVIAPVIDEILLT